MKDKINELLQQIYDHNLSLEEAQRLFNLKLKL